MEGILLYASMYGTTRRYAEELSRRTGIPAVSYAEAPDLTGVDPVVYLGGLYAGGVLGMRKTLAGLTRREGQRLILVTVGLADPADPENREHIRAGLRRQLPPELLRRAECFHLRGGIDYAALTLRHRAMMAALRASLRRKPAERRSAEDRALLETYGGRVDFTDLRALEPVVRGILGGAESRR